MSNRESNTVFGSIFKVEDRPQDPYFRTAGSSWRPLVEGGSKEDVDQVEEIKSEGELFVLRVEKSEARWESFILRNRKNVERHIFEEPPHLRRS